MRDMVLLYLHTLCRLRGLPGAPGLSLGLPRGTFKKCVSVKLFGASGHTNHSLVRQADYCQAPSMTSEPALPVGCFIIYSLDRKYTFGLRSNHATGLARCHFTSEFL